MKNNTNKIGARHGDLNFHPIKEVPAGLKEVEQAGSFILAYGEHTGHKHVIEAPKKTMQIFKDLEGRHYIKLSSEATIRHEEHKTITLMPGTYRQDMEQERDPFLDQINIVKD